jgi:4,5-DOPA dioxygenase extradiol
MNRLPTLFVPHGAPTFALDPGAAGAAMIDTVATLPRPRAIVIISAHWDTDIVSVGSAETLATIHDFYGFPQALYELTYPATGSVEASHEVSAAIAKAGLPVVEMPSQGLDHGAWIPLRLMFPNAEVPVIPVSVQSHLGVQGAYALGRALAPLVDQGFLVIGSGNLTHNLGDYRIARQNGGRCRLTCMISPTGLLRKSCSAISARCWTTGNRRPMLCARTPAMNICSPCMWH